MRNKIFTLLFVAIAAIGIAACGSSSDSTSADTSSSSGGETAAGPALKVTADPGGDLAWSPTTLSAKAGQVTLELENASSTPHNIEIEDETDPSDTVSGGDTTSVTADLKPGTYTYECDIPGHAEAGMTGKLTVK